MKGTKEMTRTELERFKLYSEIADLERRMLANAREICVSRRFDTHPDRIVLATEIELLNVEMKNKTDEFLKL